MHPDVGHLVQWGYFQIAVSFTSPLQLGTQEPLQLAGHSVYLLYIYCTLNTQLFEEETPDE